MKIAILAHLHHPIVEPYLGGTEMHTAIVADELTRRGHDVVLYAKGGSRTAADLVAIVPTEFVFGQMPSEPSTPEKDDADDVQHQSGDRSEAILVAAVTDAIEEICTGGFDVVLNNSLGPLPYTMLAGHPMLTILHTPPTLEKVLAVIESDAWQPDPRHGYVGVSESNAAAWRTVLPGVICVPNGIWLDQWTDTGEAQSGLAVWAARITPEKGLHLAIDAVRDAGMELEFSGPIANQDYYRTEIAPRLGEGVRHVGHLDHARLAHQLARGEVFVSSSVWPEPFGLTLVEAMSCGTPVAAFANGAAAEIITPGSGSLATHQTPRALAEAIQTARGCDRAAVRARAETFDAMIMIDRYEKLMSQL